jgi:hypothetical protein
MPNGDKQKLLPKNPKHQEPFGQQPPPLQQNIPGGQQPGPHITPPQLPLQQTPVVQTLPQAPQLEESLMRSVQFAKQQAGIVPVQTLPQLPQLSGSIDWFLQTPLQSPGETQTPSAQQPPMTPQEKPQTPQLLESVCGLVQTPLQSRFGEAQTQRPLSQTSFGGQI